MDNGAEEAKRHGVERSSHWTTVEKAHKIMEPFCKACGQANRHSIQVHHKFPFHYAVALGRPDLELDHRNLISLCETTENNPSPNHHLRIGHLGDFKEGNLLVEEDSTKTFFQLDEKTIEENVIYLDKVKNGRIKSLDLMTDQEKKDFRDLMDKTYPVQS